MQSGPFPWRHLVCATGLVFWAAISLGLLMGQLQRGALHLPPYENAADRVNTFMPLLVLLADVLAAGAWARALRRAARTKTVASRGWAVWGWYGPPLLKLALLAPVWVLMAILR